MKSKTKKRILLVDDEEMIRDMYGAKLELAGYSVTKVESVEAASKALEEGTYDLAFVDIVMPKHDGFSLIRSMKDNSNKNISRIPVVVLTNLDDPTSREQSTQLGCLFFLVKPKHIPSDLVRLTDEILLTKDYKGGEKLSY